MSLTNVRPGLAAVKNTPPPHQDLTASPARRRITWLDSLKGFATLCVVAGHVAGGYLRAGLYHESEYAMQFLHEAVYSFHMPLFIAISGFMFSLAYLTPRRRPRWDGLGRQVCNLLLLYVLWSAVYVGFAALFSRNVNTPLGLQSLLGIWRDPVGPYWYLYVMVALYVLYALLARLPLLPLLAASFVLCVVVSPFLPSACMVRATAFHSFFFMAGIVFQRVARPLRRSVALVALLVGVAIFARFWCGGERLHKDAFFFMLSASGTSVFLFWLFSSVRRADCGPLALVGRHALEIYVTHVPLGAGIRALFVAGGVTSCPLSLVLNILLSTALPILLAAALKKIGVYDAAFRPAYLVRRGVVELNAYIRGKREKG